LKIAEAAGSSGMYRVDKVIRNDVDSGRKLQLRDDRGKRSKMKAAAKSGWRKMAGRDYRLSILRNTQAAA
jgi:hypothetical protein